MELALEDKRIADLDDASKEERFHRLLTEMEAVESKYVVLEFRTFLDGPAPREEEEE